MGLLKLADKYSKPKLEAAYQRVLDYSNQPSYKSIKNILVTLGDTLKTEEVPTEPPKPQGITRGAKHYGGKR